MKKLLLLILTMFVPLYSLAVDQKYMPDGYVRDDTIHPYYVQLTNRYFQKVDSGRIKCDYRTYDKEVIEPLDKIIDKLKTGKIKPPAPQPSRY